MILTEKETTALRDLQTQEKSCITKYEKYAAQAKDTELQSLFRTLQQDEQKHYQSIGQALHANVCFLATDCIGTEKLVSGEYNTNVFSCDNSGLRKLLADIQVEEQNHAEMLYKYKQANAMS